MRRRKPFVASSVPIHGIADRGKGVGRTADGMVLFVEGAVPGDVVDVWVQKKRSGHGEGYLQQLITPSADRVQPFCAHFSVCGGCKWQHLDYAAQLQHKEQTVREAFERIAKVPVSDFQPILGSPQTVYYRNKLEFTFAHKRWLLPEELNDDAISPLNGLGFHRAGAFDKVVDIQHCWLEPDPSNAIRNAARELGIAQGLPFYDVRAHKGFLRNLMVRRTQTGEVMVLLSVGQPEPQKAEVFLQALLDRMPGQITTAIYCINTKMNDTVFDLDMHVYTGKGFVEERLGDLVFKIGPKSFFQTNTWQAKNLYDTVVDFASLTGTENVYDLYTGTGSIALYLARYCRKVTGVEEVPEAIADALENRDRNGISNASFYAGDVQSLLTPAFVQAHGHPDLLVTDPPRAGMHEKVVRFLLDLAPARIVYVSCNPATQARDVQWLSSGYRVRKVRPVDMFPHTHHIENVALLERF